MPIQAHLFAGTQFSLRYHRQFSARQVKRIVRETNLVTEVLQLKEGLRRSATQSSAQHRFVVFYLAEISGR